MNRPTVLTPAGHAMIQSTRHTLSPQALERARSERRQRQGKALIVAGWIAAVVGVVLYCVASFTADEGVDLAAIVLHGAIPAARAALVIVGGGTLLWITGSVMHTNALLDASELDVGKRDDGGRTGGCST